MIVVSVHTDLWEVSTIDLPLLITLVRAFHKLRLVAGSIPVVGSSCMHIHSNFCTMRCNQAYKKYNLWTANQGNGSAQFTLVSSTIAIDRYSKYPLLQQSDKM